MQYVSVHNHTDYSNIRLLDSINKVEELIDKAVELNYKGIGITDHESLSGHIKAIQYIKENKENDKIPKDFKLILGDECYLIDDIDKYKNEYDKTKMAYYHFLILAKNKEGHKLLRKISSKAWENSYNQKRMDRVPITYEQLEEIVAENPGNLIGSTACLGSYFSHQVLKASLARGEEITEAKKNIDEFLKWCIKVFGKENFFIEIQPSLTTSEQKLYNLEAYNISQKYDIPIIVTTDSHYLTLEDQDIHAAYLNSKEGDREVSDFYKSTFLMSEEQLYEYLEENGFTKEQIAEFINNTMLIYDLCEEYDLQHDPIVPKFTLPEFKLIGLFEQYYNDYSYIEKFAHSHHIQDRFLLYQIEVGIQNKFIDKKIPYNAIEISRINTELEELWEISEILGIKMSSYYNTMRKIIDIMWEDGDSIVGPARGSVTGFFIAYLIDITQVNPIPWNLPHWRHLNKYKPELADIDVDTEAMKRSNILEALKDFFGEESVINICTFGTETSKSAILTAARGLKIDVDTALYMASMVPIERGFTWSVSDCLYGNEEKERKTVHNLKKEMEKYPNLIETVLRIEGLINKRSIHASGVYIFNQHYTEFNAIMKAPNGQFITQFNMNDSDYMGGLKFDLLTVQALDKIRLTLNYLLEDKVIEDQGSLLETYKKYLHPDILDYKTPEMWEMIGQNSIPDLFQFETEVGGSAAKLIKPKNLLELATANSLMRLMGGRNKQPLDEYRDYRNNLDLWYEEMRLSKLTQKEVAILEPHLKPLYGVADTQEVVMELVMDKDIANFSLTEADKLRKAIGKKSEKVMKEIRDIYFEKGKENNTSENLLNYVWNIQIQRQLGYSFSKNHTLPYSIIALQEMNLAYHYPIIYWNTACLSVNSGSADEDQLKEQSTDYGKIASAIGGMKARGIEISLPNINESKFGFAPDAKNNRILFGMKGINKIGTDLCIEIMRQRPYKSLKDFLSKVKISKDKVVSLIKSGAFDEIENKERIDIMKDFIGEIAGTKKRLTLQNVQMLANNDLFPEHLKSSQIRVFFFNKYLKKHKQDLYYVLDEKAQEFFNEKFERNLYLLTHKEDQTLILQKTWDDIYQTIMNEVRAYIKENHDELLEKLNNKLIQAEWNKYASGNYSSWEMESVSYYHHDHELSQVNNQKYYIESFKSIPEEPKVVKTYNKGNQIINIFELYRIAGTVLDKNKYRHTVTLLTTNGVVHVKCYRDQFSYFDKQLSEVQADGTKKVIEKSWFSRGNKLLITGIRRGDTFLPKVYKNSVYQHPIYLITDIKENGEIITTANRADSLQEVS